MAGERDEQQKPAGEAKPGERAARPTAKPKQPARSARPADGKTARPQGRAASAGKPPRPDGDASAARGARGSSKSAQPEGRSPSRAVGRASSDGRSSARSEARAANEGRRSRFSARAAESEDKGSTRSDGRVKGDRAPDKSDKSGDHAPSAPMNREMKRMMAKREGAADRMRRPMPTKRTRTKPLAFLKEVRGELGRVAWPTRQETITYTLVVIITVAFFMIIIAGIDFVALKAVLFLIARGGK
jgi:preprotein translocase subunit SecE